jgi:hypothetical protein
MIVDSFATVDIFIVRSLFTLPRNRKYCRLRTRHRVLQHQVLLLNRMLLYVGTPFSPVIRRLVLSFDFKLVGNVPSLDYLYSKHIKVSSVTFVG